MKDRKLIDGFEILVIAISSIILTVLLSIDKLITYVTGSANETKTFFYDGFAERIETVLDIVSERILTPGATTYIVWAIIGLISYIAIGMLGNTISTFTDAVRTDKEFKHPKGYSKQKYWIFFAINVGLSTAFGIALILWITYGMKYLGESMSNNMLIALFSSESILSAIYHLALSVLSIFLFLFVILMIIRASKLLHEKTS